MQRTTTNVVRYVVQQHNTILITYNIPSLMKYSAMKAKSKKLLGYIVRDASPSKEEEEATKLLVYLPLNFVELLSK